MKPTGRNAPRPRREAPATTSRTVSWTREANDAVEAYADQHGMSRSAAASALVIYGVAWAQERERKRAKP